MEPMTMMALGSAIAGGMSSIFGGQAQSAAIQRQNEQAYRNWIQANSQKTFNNSREQFQATYAFEQQLKRNKAISDSAYAYQYDAMGILKANQNIAQTNMARALTSQQGALTNALLSKGISSSSGMYGMLAATQALSAIENSAQANAAIQQEKKEIDKQFKNMMSQQTESIFMPNIQLYDMEPIYGDPNAAAVGGLVSGLVQIGSGIAGAAMDTKIPDKNTTVTPRVQSSGTPSLASGTPSRASVITSTRPTSIPFYLARD